MPGLRIFPLVLLMICNFRLSRSGSDSSFGGDRCTNNNPIDCPKGYRLSRPSPLVPLHRIVLPSYTLLHPSYHYTLLMSTYIVLNLRVYSHIHLRNTTYAILISTYTYLIHYTLPSHSLSYVMLNLTTLLLHITYVICSFMLYSMPLQ